MTDSVGTTSLSTGATPAAAGGVGNYTSTGGVSTWAQPYVNDMLSTASTLADRAYTPYTGQLTAGQNALQTGALSGIGSLTAPSSQTWSGLSTEQQQGFMNPYLKDVLDPQIAEARRQSQIDDLSNRTALTKAGAYGGGRQAIMESENQRNLGTNLASITGKGYATAYDNALNQFNKEHDQGIADLTAAKDLYTTQYGLGEKERGITQEGLSSAYQQWQNEKQYPYDQLKFQQSMLSGLPITQQTVAAKSPSMLSSITSAISGVASGSNAALNMLKTLGIVPSTATLSDAVGQAWDRIKTITSGTAGGESLASILSNAGYTGEGSSGSYDAPTQAQLEDWASNYGNSDSYFDSSYGASFGDTQ
jgi:hypothetical protein